jgi:molecular chaperone HtpG
MSRPLEQMPMMMRLSSLREPQLYGKVLELRDVIEGWLSYIPHTFPHYTRHTRLHSEEIILQLSKLLFMEEDPERPVLNLSPIELYILMAAAYLHDAGMVSSDREKAVILSSDEWKEWVAEGGGGFRRWHETQALRDASHPEDAAVRNFLADLETRFLLAEFVRRAHHLRAKDVIVQYEPLLAGFSFGDGALRRAIADTCVAHGLHHYELDDSERYPDRRDIHGYPVNLRLMAVLLRLGDLLDLSHDRACPLLMNAASPLPADSFAHWTQYDRIVGRLTAPDRIEIAAECETDDEHRILQDWCDWIVREISNAANILSRSQVS